MISHKHYLDFLFENNLTPSQFLLLHLVYKKDQEYIDKYIEIFPTEDGSMIGRILTKDLIDKGWLKVKNNRELVATDKYRQLFISDVLGFKELVEVYPKYYMSDKGVNMPLILADYFTYSLKYGGKINNSIKEHNEILKDIIYGKENNLINFKLEKFIDSEYWEILRNKRLEEGDDFSVYTDNTFE